MAPMSAPMLMVLATRSRVRARCRIPGGNSFRRLSAKPCPVTRPTWAEISWIPLMRGYENSMVHSIPNPNWLPTWE